MFSLIKNESRAGVVHTISVVAKVLSAPPGEYGRKAETQRN